MKKDKKSYHECCLLCCENANKWREKPFDKKMLTDYRLCINKVMRTFFNIQTQNIIDDFIDSCGFGNWERFWVNENEKDKTIDEWAQDLWVEVLYCSDRWTWDRLIRTNWIFQRVISLDRVGKKTYRECVD